MEFLECQKNKAQSDEEDCDSVELWEAQKTEYLIDNPSHSGLFEKDEESDEETIREEQGPLFNIVL